MDSPMKTRRFKWIKLFFTSVLRQMPATTKRSKHESLAMVREGHQMQSSWKNEDY